MPDIHFPLVYPKVLPLTGMKSSLMIFLKININRGKNGILLMILALRYDKIYQYHHIT